MITKRILDFDYQLNRIFGKFIPEKTYDRPDNAKGIYDIIVCHREGFQGNFDQLLNYSNDYTKIVVDITTESGNLQMFLDDFVKKTNNHTNKFYLIIDSDISNFLKNINLNSNVKILQGFDLVFYSFLNETSDNRLDNDNKIFADSSGFISLNNSCRLHRIFLLSELIRLNISLDNCSFLFSTGGHLGSKFNKDVYLESIDKLYVNNIINTNEVILLNSLELPKNLDYNLNEYSYINNQINELYKPILNLVTENVMGMTDGDESPFGLITFTEKIIKPFLAKQIPLFIALPGLQEVLRNLGFDLFDDLIVTSYEKESNPIYRIKSTVTELQRLLQIDLIQYKKNNQHRFDYNYNLLEILTKSGEEKVKSFLYEEILK
jgi:hypothetical protein